MNLSSQNMQQNDYLSSFVSYGDVFTPLQCQQIIAMKSQFPAEVSPVGNALENNKQVRNSINYTLMRTPQNAWIYERLMQVTRSYNQLTQFNLKQMEALQLLEYHSGGFFTWHLDLGIKQHSTRKISLVVLLSSPSDFEGGQLEFSNMDQVDNPNLQQGAGVWFPSYLMHQVKAVTQGVRYTLVSWINGDAFR